MLFKRLHVKFKTMQDFTICLNIKIQRYRSDTISHYWFLLGNDSPRKNGGAITRKWIQRGKGGVYYTPSVNVMQRKIGFVDEYYEMQLVCWFERITGKLIHEQGESPEGRWWLGFPKCLMTLVIKQCSYAAYLAPLVILVQVLDKVDFPYLYLS